MLRFQVPQFIERELRIVGDITFKQLIVLVVAGASVFLFYALFAKTNFTFFLMVSSASCGLAFLIGFVKINGQPLPILFLQYLGFNLSPKKYLWKKKSFPPRIIWKKVENPMDKKKTEKTSLIIAEKSRIKRIAANIH